MTRYCSIPPNPRRSYFDDEYPDQIVVPNVTVADHVPVDTGLIDMRGNAIMRLPLPVGFGRDNEW